MNRSIWHVLGIAPTEDVGAIRRAYAVALKVIDPERDPRSFIELRAAYDEARSPRIDRSESAPTISAPRDAGISRAVIRADRAEIEGLVSEITDRLAANEPGLSAHEVLADLTLRLLAQADLELVDRQAQIEEWLASTIAATIPRSDAMILPVQAYYRWHSRQHNQHRPDRVSVIVDRWRDLIYAEHVLFRETGRHHRAFQALQSLPGTGLLVRQDLATLLAIERFFREHGHTPRIANVDLDPVVLLQWQDQLTKNVLRLDRYRYSAKPMVRAGKLVIAGVVALSAIGLTLALLL